MPLSKGTKIAAAATTAIASITGLGWLTSQYKIVEGKAASIRDVPWQVAILNEKQGTALSRLVCGGAIVGSSWVMTAYHCLQTTEHPETLEILAGATMLDAPLSRHHILKDGIYRSSLPSLGLAHPHDWVLLHVAPAFTYSDDIQSIALPRQEDDRGDAMRPMEMGISGWGDTDPNPLHFTFSNRIKRAKRMLGLQTACVSDWGSNNAADTNFCAEYTNVQDGVTPGSACVGDSGGPVTNRSAEQAVLWGVISAGPEKCDHQSMLAVRLSSYSSAIECVMNHANARQPIAGCPDIRVQ